MTWLSQRLQQDRAAGGVAGSNQELKPGLIEVNPSLGDPTEQVRRNVTGCLVSLVSVLRLYCVETD